MISTRKKRPLFAAIARASRMTVATVVIGTALVSLSPTTGHAMLDGDGYGDPSSHYYLNPWAPFRLAYNVVRYAVRIPIYVLRAPWEFVRRMEGYQDTM